MRQVFAEDGRMKSRQMSGNTVKIANEERWFKDGVDVNVSSFPSAFSRLRSHYSIP